MNYWTELGWIILPMMAVELSFTVIMCLGAHWLDTRRGK